MFSKRAVVQCRPGALIATRRRVIGGGAALLASGGLPRCAAPSGGTAGPALEVLVANGGDGTVTRLDAQTGRPLGAPVPAGPGAWRPVAGPAGNLLVLTAGTSERPVTYATWTGAGWVARPLALEADATALHVAGDGGRYAAVAYRLPPAKPARARSAGSRRLALVDLLRGEVVQSHTLAAPDDSVTGLALENDASGPTAYVGIWHPAREAGGRWAPAAGRVLAVDARTGPAAAHPVGGVLGQVALGPSPSGAGRRLYFVEALEGPDDSAADDPFARFAAAAEWRLLGLNPVTLEVESEYPLPYPPHWLTLAPDGLHAYAVPEPGTNSTPARLLRIHLTTGGVTLLDRLPARTLDGLAVTRDRIFLPDVAHDQVWMLDRRGRPLGTVRVGQHPTGIGLSRGP
jgi:hypothetical protein